MVEGDGSSGRSMMARSILLVLVSVSAACTSATPTPAAPAATTAQAYMSDATEAPADSTSESLLTTAPVAETQPPLPDRVDPIEAIRTLPLPDPISEQPGAATVVAGVGLLTSDPDPTYHDFEIVHVSEGSTTPIGVQHSNFWEIRGGPDGRLYLRDGTTLTSYRFVNGAAVLQDGPVAITTPMPCAVVVQLASVSCGDATIPTGVTIEHGEQAVVHTSYKVPTGAEAFIGDAEAQCGSPATTAPRCNTYTLVDGTSVIAVPFIVAYDSSPHAGISLATTSSAAPPTVLPAGQIIGLEGAEMYLTTYDAATSTYGVSIYDLSALTNL